MWVKTKTIRPWTNGVLVALSTVLVNGVPAVAEVVSAAAGGFTVSSAAQVAAAPEAAFRQLVDIASWWSPDHTYSGDAANLSLEARPGGCFCERLANGGGVRHLDVVYVEPPARLRLRGGLGPLQAMAVEGSMTWAITAVEVGTRIELTYAVVGYHPDGLQGLAPVVDAVLTEQLGRLKDAIEAARNPKPRPEDNRQ